MNSCPRTWQAVIGNFRRVKWSIEKRHISCSGCLLILFNFVTARLKGIILSTWTISLGCHARKFLMIHWSIVQREWTARISTRASCRAIEFPLFFKMKPYHCSVADVKWDLWYIEDEFLLSRITMQCVHEAIISSSHYSTSRCRPIQIISKWADWFGPKKGCYICPNNRTTQLPQKWMINSIEFPVFHWFLRFLFTSVMKVTRYFWYF